MAENHKPNEHDSDNGASWNCTPNMNQIMHTQWHSLNYFVAYSTVRIRSTRDEWGEFKYIHIVHKLTVYPFALIWELKIRCELRTVRDAQIRRGITRMMPSGIVKARREKLLSACVLVIPFAASNFVQCLCHTKKALPTLWVLCQSVEHCQSHRARCCTTL